jgi:hypothetical protein
VALGTLLVSGLFFLGRGRKKSEEKVQPIGIPKVAGFFASPRNTTVVAWFFLFALHYSYIITYHGRPNATSAVLYLVLCITLFVGGHYFGFSPEGFSHGEVPSGVCDSNLWKRETLRNGGLISFFAVIGILGAILFGIEMISYAHSDPSDLLSTRELYAERDVTNLSRIASTLGAGGFFSLVAAILCWEWISKGQKVLWLLSPLSLSLFSIFSAGRQTVLQLVLIPLIALSVRRASGQLRLRGGAVKAGFLVFIVLIIGYGMYASHQRNTASLEMSKKKLLMGIFNSELHPTVDAVLEEVPDIIRDGVTEAIVYFSHEIPSFQVFWSLPPAEMHWGTWQLPFLARRLYEVGLLSTSVEEQMLETYRRFEETGHFSQVWQTVIRDFILDFGYIGAPAVVMFLGFICGRIYSSFLNGGGLYLAFLLIGVNLCCAYSIMLAAVSDTLVFFYLLLSALLLSKDIWRPSVIMAGISYRTLS